MSFYRWKGFGPMDDFVGLRQLRLVLTDDVFTDAVLHNFIIVVLSILVQLPLGLAIALLLNRRIRGRGLLRTIIFVPYVLAEVIAGVVWFQLLQPESGVVDGLLGAVGLTAAGAGLPRHARTSRCYTVFVGADLEVPRARGAALPRRPAGRPRRAVRGGPARRAPAGGRSSGGSPSRCSGPRSAPGCSCR